MWLRLPLLASQPLVLDVRCMYRSPSPFQHDHARTCTYCTWHSPTKVGRQGAPFVRRWLRFQIWRAERNKIWHRSPFLAFLLVDSCGYLSCDFEHWLNIAYSVCPSHGWIGAGGSGQAGRGLCLHTYTGSHHQAGCGGGVVQTSIQPNRVFVCAPRQGRIGYLDKIWGVWRNVVMTSAGENIQWSCSLRLRAEWSLWGHAQSCPQVILVSLQGGRQATPATRFVLKHVIRHNICKNTERGFWEISCYMSWYNIYPWYITPL